jgi:hypothetical protein
MTTKITVNEKVYDSVDEMPPDVRAMYEKAMSVASAAEPSIKHSEIKVMFQVGGSPIKFQTRPRSTPTGETPGISLGLVQSQADNVDEPRPIEPSSGNVTLQIALVLFFGIAIGLAFWFWARH